MNKGPKIELAVCPYFWISSTNNCKAAGKPKIVKWDHHEKYCVSTRYRDCPVYISSKKTGKQKA